MARAPRALPLAAAFVVLALAAAASYAEVWSVDGAAFATGDVDNDQTAELVVLPCEVYTCSLAGCKREYGCGASAKDVWSVAVGDVDNDRANELVLGHSGSVGLYDCGGSGCVAAGTGETLYSGRAVGLAVGDANSDGQNVLLVGTNPVKDCSAGRVICDEGQRKTWGLLIVYGCTATGCTDRWSYEMLGAVERIGIGDVDGDGKKEVMASRSVLECASSSCKANGGAALDPQLVSDGSFLGEVVGTGDLDGDGDLELVTRAGNNLYVYACGGSSCKRVDAALPPAGAAAVGRLGGGPDVIVIGNATDSSLSAHSLANGATSSRIIYASAGGGGVEQLAVIGTGDEALVVARLGGKVRLFAPRLETGEACGSDAECATGICARGACTNGSSGAPCEAAEDCAAANCRASVCCAQGLDCCGSDGDCAAGVCDKTTHACRARAEGEACARGAECATATCTNGVCCAAGRACCRADADCEDRVCSAGECRPLYDAVKVFPPNGTALAPGAEVYVTGTAGDAVRRAVATYPAALVAGSAYSLAWSFDPSLGIGAGNTSIASVRGPGGAVVGLEWRSSGPGRSEANFTVPASGAWEIVVDAQGNGVGYVYRLSGAAPAASIAPQLVGSTPAPTAAVASATPAPTAAVAAPSATPEPSPGATQAATPEATLAPEPEATAVPPAPTPAPSPAPAQEESLRDILLSRWMLWRLGVCAAILLVIAFLERAPLARRLDGALMAEPADPQRPTATERLRLSLRPGYEARLRPSLAPLLEAPRPQTYYPAHDTPYSREAIAQAVRYDTIDRKELVEKLKTLRDLLEGGLITQEDYDRKKEEYLSRF